MILITGSNGFVGKHVTSLLLEKGNTNISASTKREWDLLALGQPELLIETIQPTHLVHLAWVTEHSKYLESPENELWRDSTIRLAKAFGENGGKRMVVAGSKAEFGKSLYGQMKTETRKALSDISDQYGFSLVWGRIYQPFGPFEKLERLIPSAINFHLSGRVFWPKNPTDTCELIYVKDLTSLIVKFLIESDYSGEVDFSSYLVSVQEIVSHISGQEIVENLTKDAVDIMSLFTDFRFTPLAEAFSETIDWWKSKVG